MLQTPLHKQHLKLHAKMAEYAGFDMPISYSNIIEEHLAVRHHFGIFDVSHMGEILIEGNDAFAYASFLVSNQIQTNKVTYALLLNDHGFPLDDLLVYVLKKDQILFVVNAGNALKDYEWISTHTTGFDVTTRHISDRFSQLAIQGPKTATYINQIVKHDVTDLTFMTFKVIPYREQFLIVSRTGYTGEDGFEIYCHNQDVDQLWQDSLDAGAVPCGLGARDTLRFQATLPLYGHEMSEMISPFESRLSFAVDFNHDFIGKSALLKLKENQTSILVGIELLQRNVPRQGYDVYHEDEWVGWITTGYLLPETDKPLALAMVNKKYSKFGTNLTVQIRKKRVAAVVRNRKFYQKNYER